MTRPTLQPITVVCDRCRAEGRTGEDVFAQFGALLDFEPVPRHAKRADGWDAELQRAFVALLSLTGSVKAACRALGKSEFGITQMLRQEGAAGFSAAMDEAFAIADGERSNRIAGAIRAVAEEKAGRRPPSPPWSKAATRRGRHASAAPAPHPSLPPRYPAPGEEEWRDELGYTREERLKLDALEPVFKHYMQRVAMERQARLAGKICEADFYVRQITVQEIVLQLLIRGSSRAAMQEIQKLRAGPHHLNTIAETVMSRLLDDARREQWARLGEPARPAPPGPDLTIAKGELKLLRQESFSGPDWKEQMRAYEEAHAAAAREQVEWEAKALAEAEAWRKRLEAEAAAAEQGAEAEDGEAQAEAQAEAQENPSPVRGEGHVAQGDEGEGESGTVTS